MDLFSGELFMGWVKKMKNAWVDLEVGAKVEETKFCLRQPFATPMYIRSEWVVEWIGSI